MNWFSAVALWGFKFSSMDEVNYNLFTETRWKTPSNILFQQAYIATIHFFQISSHGYSIFFLTDT